MSEQAIMKAREMAKYFVDRARNISNDDILLSGLTEQLLPLLQLQAAVEKIEKYVDGGFYREISAGKAEGVNDQKVFYASTKNNKQLAHDTSLSATLIKLSEKLNG